MEKRFLFILLLFVSSITTAQSHEVGVFLGGSNYVGDIGRTNYIYPNEFSGGIVYKYNLNPRIALRGNYNYVPVSGNDLDSESSYRLNRNPSPIKFSNTVHEFAVGTEFNFYEYDISDYKTSFTPYILAQFALINHKSPASLIGTNTIRLENTFSYAIPVGLGIKGRLDDKFAFALEAAARYTFTDELDYSNNKFPFFNIEGNGNDWYFFTGISIVYTFGKPACYNGLTKQ